MRSLGTPGCRRTRPRSCRRQVRWDQQALAQVDEDERHGEREEDDESVVVEVVVTMRMGVAAVRRRAQTLVHRRGSPSGLHMHATRRSVRETSQLRSTETDKCIDAGRSKSTRQQKEKNKRELLSLTLRRWRLIITPRLVSCLSSSSPSKLGFGMATSTLLLAIPPLARTTLLRTVVFSPP